MKRTLCTCSENRVRPKLSIPAVGQKDRGSGDENGVLDETMSQEFSFACPVELIAASEAPWVRKIGNSSSRENLVMTSAHDRASERTSVQTQGEGEGRLEIFLTVTHMGNSFLGGFLFRKVRKTVISVCHVTKRSEWSI